jgi:hypothetical protein
MNTLLTLPAQIAVLPADLRDAAQRIFHVELAQGQLLPPPTMDAWIIKQFGSLAAVREQHTVSIINRLTLEGALFNPLRASRPAGTQGSDADLERWVAEELSDDMFAQPLRDTPADLFGRITGRFCVTASNVAKYDAWHGLVVLTEPHPLHFGPEHIRDYVDVALRWITAAHAADPQARYPLITWNCLPKSGATIVHGHWQIAIARGMPYVRVEAWRRAMQQYRLEAGREYLADLAAIHALLGLDLGLAGVHAFAHLTPLRNREVVILANPTPDAAILLADAICAVLRGLIDRLGMRSFNLAIALPPRDSTIDGWHEFPMLVRIGDRGPALTSRNDLGAMELYGTGVISAVPFDVARGLQLCGGI